MSVLFVLGCLLLCDGLAAVQADCLFSGANYADTSILYNPPTAATDLQKNCFTFTCIGEAWKPNEGIHDDCRFCTVSNDPHFFSFGEATYEFMGHCNYTLNQHLRKHNRWPMHPGSSHANYGVYADFRECALSPENTCIHDCTFKASNKTIIKFKTNPILEYKVEGHMTKLKNTSTLVTDKAMLIGHPIDQVLIWKVKKTYKVKGVTKTQVCIRVAARDLNIECCRNQITLWILPGNEWSFSGLCGRNAGTDMDLVTADGHNESPLFNLHTFAFSYMVENQTDIYCKYVTAEKSCEALDEIDQTCTAGVESNYPPNTITPEQKAHYIKLCTIDICYTNHTTPAELRRKIEHWTENMAMMVANNVENMKITKV